MPQENMDLGFASSAADHPARKPVANALWIAERHVGKYNKAICLAFKTLASNAVQMKLEP